MKKTIFLILGIVVVLILGYQVFDAYIANHTYYRGTSTSTGMLGSASNWKNLIRSIVFALIPVSYLLFMKKKTLRGFSITLFSGLFLYSVAEAIIKLDILGPGFLLMLFKYAIIFAIIAYFIVGLLATGTWIRKKIFGEHQRTIEQIFLNIGLGLIAFCIITTVLILVNLFYGIIIAAIFVGFGVCSRMMRKELKPAQHKFEEILNILSREKVKRSPMFFVYALLILFSIVYAYHGFVLADIPYPTAWDANHAYMYYPRIRALNNGYYWEQSLSMTPHIWYGYITFRFKFMYIFGTDTWISADNLAVIMNFISAIFVLVFGIVLMKEVIRFIQGDDESNNSMLFSIGWFLLILWLSSGMGAFLVFVDNKTDLGIMALTILALYSGFLFINQLAASHEKRHSLQYVLLSGLFFGAAILAKPTATFDVINFSILIIALWFGGLLAFGIFLGIMGTLGKSGVLTAQKFMSEAMSTKLLAAGGVISVAGIIFAWMKKKWQNLRYVLIWAVVIIGTLVIVKLPYLLVKQIKIDNHFSPTKLIKDIFLTKNDTVSPAAKTDRVFLASTVDYKTLLAADVGGDTSDETPVAEGIIASCKARDISTEDLYANLKSPPGSSLNEDVGRYVGYGWREFLNPWRGFVVGQGCHATTADAKILCENAALIENPTASGMQELFDKLPDNSEGKALVSSILNSTGTAISTSREGLQNLKAYYQDHSWRKVNNKVSIPYIALTPFNITFNWSLQNLTSYYTDIGVIRLICLFVILLGFIFSLVKWNRKLFAVTLAALGGWALRRVAGGAILWYSLGVIIWTVIATICVLYAFGQGNNKTQKNLYMVMIIILAFIGLYQLLLNFIRISSQGGGGPFVWYRANVGNVTYIDNNLQQQTKQQIGYNDKDVFNMQFGHYNAVLAALDDRPKEVGLIVAGTYLPYFLDNQEGMQIDGFLVDFWKNLSDNDPCNTYLRMNDKKIGYIVIDPNIASVVMGDANSTLLDRIFGKLDDSSKRVLEYGSMTMIANMVKQGYMSLEATNIISAKYAFELSSAELQASFGAFGNDDDVLRAKLATLRFRPEAEQLYQALPAIFNKRMLDGNAISDIASILGKDVDASKLNTIAVGILSQKKLQSEAISELNDDEKNVLVQYLSIYNMMKSNTQQYQQVVSSILQQSVLGNSQVMLFKVN